MKYVRADAVLPVELLTEVQKYLPSGLVYIPKAQNSRMGWGTISGERGRLDSRNKEIKAMFSESAKSIEALAGEYHLSVETVKNIVYRR